MINEILEIINFNGVLSLLCLLLIIFFFIFERLNTPKYKKTKNVRNDLIDIREIEDVVISVLESWNKKNLSSEKNFYSSDLLRKQEKHLVKNGVQDKSEMIWDVKVEGLNNFTIHKNKITIEVSFIARFNCIYGDNNYLLGIAPFDFRTFIKTEQTEEENRFNVIKDVQKWQFILEDGQLRADKFNLNF